jgi:hypothetical protein
VCVTGFVRRDCLWSVVCAVLLLGGVYAVRVFRVMPPRGRARGRGALPSPGSGLCAPPRPAPRWTLAACRGVWRLRGLAWHGAGHRLVVVRLVPTSRLCPSALLISIN